MYFNPRSLTGATLRRGNALLCTFISIHAPSRERRHYKEASIMTIGISIHAPSRERHVFFTNINTFINISIHAPSRERPQRPACRAEPENFNPRSLTGATLSNSILIGKKLFQSTLPHGSDRSKIYHSQRREHISIHAPSRERLSSTYSSDSKS